MEYILMAISKQLKKGNVRTKRQNRTEEKIIDSQNQKGRRRIL
jgi:hypothetical protein